MTSSGLRRCPQCFRDWPGHSVNHDLRGFRWLDPLPRRISVSNADLLLHDGVHGRDRYLFVEVKMRWEQALQAGQNWLLRALARQEGWTVRLLHDGKGGPSLHRVTRDGVDASGSVIERDAFRASVVGWLDGGAWTDPRGQAREPEHAGLRPHLCGWVRDGEVWRCAQDYYAKGEAPETSCGATWSGDRAA